MIAGISLSGVVTATLAPWIVERVAEMARHTRGRLGRRSMRFEAMLSNKSGDAG
jgi:hypothetical protein